MFNLTARFALTLALALTATTAFAAPDRVKVTVADGKARTTVAVTVPAAATEKEVAVTEKTYEAKADAENRKGKACCDRKNKGVTSNTGKVGGTQVTLLNEGKTGYTVVVRTCATAGDGCSKKDRRFPVTARDLENGRVTVRL